MKRNFPELIRTIVRAAPHLTGRGIFLLWLSLGLLLVGSVVPSAVLIEIAIFFLSLILLAAILCHLNLSQLSLTHSLPDGVFSKEDFDVKFSLSNTKRTLISLDASVSCRLTRKTHTVEFASIQSRDSDSQTAMFRITRRGVHEGLWYRIHSAFPFGLAEQRKEGTRSSRIIVYPHPILPPHVLDMLESGMGYGLNARRSAKDVSGQFKLMRDFYPGDSAKLISWPASQRRDKLIVKEMEQPGPQQLTILFHSYQPPNVVLSRRSFENSLQILSGIFTHLLDNGLPVSFSASFNNWAPMRVEADRNSQRKAFELLASAAMAPSTRQADFTAILRRESSGDRPVMVLSNTPVRFWAEFVAGSRTPAFCCDNRESTVVTCER